MLDSVEIKMRALAFAAPLAACLALAGCNASAPPSAASAPLANSIRVTPEDFHLPEGSGCSGDIARYRAVMDNDLRMGHVNQSVYDQIQGEIGGADSACKSGQDAHARALVHASKSRHGYPG
jgi:hypothetical protein